MDHQMTREFLENCRIVLGFLVKLPEDTVMIDQRRNDIHDTSLILPIADFFVLSYFRRFSSLCRRPVRVKVKGGLASVTVKVRYGH
jgi:hypothetical protein